MVKKILTGTVVLFLISSVLYGQKDAKFSEEMKLEMCSKVKSAAQHAWQGYTQYARGGR
jgi:hypothetical protein